MLFLSFTNFVRSIKATKLFCFSMQLISEFYFELVCVCWLISFGRFQIRLIVKKISYNRVSDDSKPITTPNTKVASCKQTTVFNQGIPNTHYKSWSNNYFSSETKQRFYYPKELYMQTICLLETRNRDKCKQLTLKNPFCSRIGWLCFINLRLAMLH